MVPDETLPSRVGRYAGEVRAALTATGAWLAARPPVLAAALALLALGYAAARLFAPLPAGTWPWLGDSVIFEYIGWFLTEGNRLYIDVWEVKPPLAFEVTAALALLAGENVVRYHLLNLAANAAAIAVGAAVAAGIVDHLTDDALGAVVAGVAPFVLPMYFYRALVGFKPKYLIVAAGLGCLYLSYRDRPLAAGVAGAAAVGLWQFALVFPACALGLCWQRDGRRGAGRVVLGGLATAAVILLPVVYWGALPAMAAETLLVPLLLVGEQPLPARVLALADALWVWLPVALLGLVGLVRHGWSRLARTWPLLVVAGWFTVQLLALDYDNPPDLFPWVAVVSVGVGLTIADLRDWASAADVRGWMPAAATRWAPAGLHDRDAPVGRETAARVLAAGVLVLATVSVATMGGFGVWSGRTDPKTYDTTRTHSPNVSAPDDLDGVEYQYVYWNRVSISTCRAFGGANQFRLVKRLDLANGGRWETAPCGRFTPLWDAVRAQYGP
ncbi:DolP-mannose mannosyltransferase [Haloglomus litoreum]|uniref:DolP-mannose mannosyltransferase n=1 Tax=Haloglomus litoreum TaxID=3034026 RepID=UPI0023E7B67F|nr:DolP-mannose mannosyltransferase [Haloglomus sp. DT116]